MEHKPFNKALVHEILGDILRAGYGTKVYSGDITAAIRAHPASAGLTTHQLSFEDSRMAEVLREMFPQAHKDRDGRGRFWANLVLASEVVHEQY